MADITRVGTPSLSTTVPCPAHHISGLLAGETISAGMPCYVASTGKVMKSIGTAANAAAKVDGWCLQDAVLNDGISLYFDVNVRYGSALTPGARYYVSATAGGGVIGDAATTGGTAPVAFAIDATRIRVLQSRY